VSARRDAVPAYKDHIATEWNWDMRIITITGASGTGKTSLSQAYHDAHRNIPFYRFDTVGVPSEEKMIADYGSGEEWQRQMTIEWMKRIAADNANADWVLFEGQTRPQFINEAYRNAGIEGSYILCLWCNVSTMKQRLLHQRQQPDLFHDQMINWGNMLRKWSEECENGVVVDTSGNDAEKNLANITAAIDGIMANRPVNSGGLSLKLKG
jgi:broad-specificity NMP kinase